MKNNLKTFHISKSEIAYASLIFLALCLLWNYVAGKEVGFDTLNYHYGLAHVFAEGDINNFFFPANMQSTLNPMGYLPFYWMVKLNWHSLLISSILSAIHSLSFLSIYLITRKLTGNEKGSISVSVLTALLANLSLVQLIGIGSSSVDNTTAAIFLSATIWLLWIEKIKVNAYFLFAIGAAIGFASVLKLPLIVLAVITPIFLLRFEQPLKRALPFCFGGLVGGFVGGGVWHWQMWEKYANPFFPFFNNVFKSPLFSEDSMRHYRFLDTGLMDFVSRPFNMAIPNAGIHTEGASPDFRHLLVLAIVVSIIVGTKVSKRSLKNLFGVELTLLLTFFTIAFLIWSFSSGNSRYFLPILPFATLITTLAVTSFASIKKAKALLLIAIVAQSTATLMAGDNTRFSKGAWTKTWFEFSELSQHVNKDKPALYVSNRFLSPTFVLNYAHRGAGFLSLGGQIDLPNNQLYRERVHNLAKRFEYQTKSITYTRGKPESEGEIKARMTSNTKSAFSDWGLEQNDESCKLIKSDSPTSNQSVYSYLLLCDLYLSEIPEDTMSEFNQAESMFRSIEEHCGEMLLPKWGGAIRGSDGSWSKSYILRDLTTSITNEGLIYVKHRREYTTRYLGSIEDINTHEGQLFTSKACESIGVDSL